MGVQGVEKINYTYSVYCLLSSFSDKYNLILK